MKSHCHFKIRWLMKEATRQKGDVSASKATLPEGSRFSSQFHITPYKALDQS